MALNELKSLDLSSAQINVIQASPHRKLFFSGPAGAGKTTAGLLRLTQLIELGVSADSILVLVPQRTLAEPYYRLIRDPSFIPGGIPTVATVGGLARRMVDLFWPLVAEDAHFAQPDHRPVFLTLETAQYYMARVVAPIIEKTGYFESVTIDRNRLYSQIIDNLNKAAVVGFPVNEIAQRLSGAWVGEQAHTRIYEHAQECALAFRAYCLAHNLLDFSLQIEVFFKHLWHEPLCRNAVETSFQHVIYDNIEEDTPVAHDFMVDLLKRMESSLIIYDTDAGYRQFLGADPEGAMIFADICDTHISAEDSFVISHTLAWFSAAFASVLGLADQHVRTEGPHHIPNLPAQTKLSDFLRYEYHRYHPQMLDWVTDQIEELVRHQGIEPGEIVVVAPFVSDALRFSLEHRLTQADIPVRAHRPSRALRDEPATQSLLTLAALAHPQWGVIPSSYDVAYTLTHAICNLDPVRAKLLTDVLYRVKEGKGGLLPFDTLNPDMQQRITYVLGERYEKLRAWLDAYQSSPPAALDHFMARLFGEVLSITGFGFHNSEHLGQVSALLIESIRKFRWISADVPDEVVLGNEYVRLVREGVIAAQYLAPWQLREEDSVLLSPAYTFLLSNRPVSVQFWLDVGSKGWWERLYQPLTHPVVLSRRWPMGKPWTDADEVTSRQISLYHVVLGLIRRCRETIYLGLSELGEEGYEQDGALLKAIQRILRHL